MRMKRHMLKKIVVVALLSTIFLYKGGVLPAVSYAAQTSEAIAQDVDMHKESDTSTCDSNIKNYTKSNIYKNVLKYARNQTFTSAS